MKKKETYLNRLLNDIVFIIMGIVISIIIASGFFYLFFAKDIGLKNAKEKGTKVIATIADIEERGNPLHNPYEENRSIRNMTLTYSYRGKEYTNVTSSSYKKASIGDVITIYIIDNNPNNIVVELPNSSWIPYFAFALLGLILIGCIYSLIVTIKQCLLYKKSQKFATITGNFSHIESRNHMGYTKYYIICESDEIGGFNRSFKSHYYSENPSDFIEKRNRKTFKIKYNPANPKEYIVDTDGFDNQFLK